VLCERIVAIVNYCSIKRWQLKKKVDAGRTFSFLLPDYHFNFRALIRAWNFVFAQFVTAPEAEAACHFGYICTAREDSHARAVDDLNMPVINQHARASHASLLAAYVFARDVNYRALLCHIGTTTLYLSD
jgi:hypothetical protein